MRRLLLAAGLTLLAWIGLTSPTAAWGAQGHHVVARLAWALLTPAARSAVESLLGEGQDPFVSASTWADDVRSTRPETYNWHFVDIPTTSARYDALRDCKPTDRGDCVIAEIGRARAELADRNRSKELRAESLKFLIHFVGDLHQPLHAIDNRDKGGNDVHVQSLRDGAAGRATNLHSAWDTGIINLSTETEAARAERLLGNLKAHPRDIKDDVAAWADESHDVALRDVYRYNDYSTAGPPPDAVALSPEYLRSAGRVIDEQLMAGGARLAFLINRLFDR